MYSYVYKVKVKDFLNSGKVLLDESHMQVSKASLVKSSICPSAH